MSVVKPVRVLGAAVAAFLLVPLTAVPVQADPLPAVYSGSTHGDVLSLDLTAAGIDDINAGLGHSATATDSTGPPRAHAESANLHAGALGIPVGPVAAQANATNATPTDSYSAGLGQVDVPGVLDTGLLSARGTRNWAGDAACVPDGQPIATSTTSVAGAPSA